MKVQLTKLEVVNYRNIGHATYQFDGNSKIVGENRIGKTNTLEAIVWLLTDKLLNGSSDIPSIKPLTDTKSQVMVEGTFLVGDKTIVLRKEYGEDWVKTRGTTDLVFKGHYLTYYYNGVKQKTQRDFYALFKEDFCIPNEVKGIDFVRLLIDPFCVGELGEKDSWKDLRAFIISLIGDVDDAQVFLNNPALRMIEGDLKDRNGRIDEVKKFYSNEIKGIEEQIIGTEAQIQMLLETECPTDEEILVAKEGVQRIDEEIAKLQSDKASDSAIIDIDKAINDKKATLLKIKEEELKKNPTKDLEEKLAKKNEDYRALLSQKTNLIERISDLKTQINNYKSKIDIQNERKNGYIAQLTEIDEKIANPVFDSVCPTCHRPFEGAELEKAREDYIERLKEEREGILLVARQNKAERDANVDLCSKATDNLAEMEMAQNDLVNDISACLTEIERIHKDILTKKEEDVDINMDEVLLLEEIKNLEDKRRTVAADINASNSIIRERIEEKMATKQTFQKILDDLAYAKRQKENLETMKGVLECKQKTLASMEQKKELINLFIKTKLSLLDEKVERVFGKVKFQLIKENINGGYDPVCKPYIYDVDKDESTNVTWRNGSKSEQVITGIAICERIKAALHLFDLPFLFDEGGEISTDTFNTKFKTDSQLICVKVTDNIKTPMVMKI